MAGFIDGEGSILICRQSWKTKTIKRGNFYPRIAVFNTNKEILEYIKNTLNCGNVKISTKTHGNYKIVYRWEIGKGEDIKRTLEFIKPHLKVKVKQAEILINFLETKDLSQKEIYFNQVRELNRKGVLK